MERNKVCHVCGKEYHYCPTCPRDAMKPSWYTLFCSDQCKDIDDVLSKHTYKRITDVKAAKELLALGADAMNVKDEAIRAHIDNILVSARKAEKSVKMRKTQEVSE